MSIKWTSFTSGGELSVGNQVVGLSSDNLNRRFAFPGTGIKDADGVYLLRWLPSISTATNYITFSNASTGTSPSIAASGSDANVGIDIVGQGTGNINLTTTGDGMTIMNSTSAVKIPVGTSVQRPTGVPGLIRYNTTLQTLEVWDSGAAAYAQLYNTADPLVESVTSADNSRITIAGTATHPTVNISNTYAGQSSISVVGNLSSGVWQAAPISVPYGGTGNVSFTDYAVLCGGNVSTGIRTVSGVGTAGQVLTSAGAGVVPIWQNLNGNQKVQGRLTLTTGVPITTSDVTSAGTVYFTPFQGNYVSLYNGTTWLNYSFSQMSLSLSGLAINCYDLFVELAAGIPSLTALAWTNTTTRATSLTRQDGLLVLTGSTGRLYVGTLYIRATGLTDDAVNTRYLWNNFNRVIKPMSYYPTGTWTYNSATIRQANASTNSQLNFIVGLVEDMIMGIITVGWFTTAGSYMYLGIGLNSTTTAASLTPGGNIYNSAAANLLSTVYFYNYAALGLNKLVWLEGSAAGVTTTYFGIFGPTIGGMNGYIPC